MTYKKLRTCPWCGRQTQLKKYGELYSVECDNSECNRVCFVYYNTVGEAVDGWNNEESLRGIDKGIGYISTEKLFAS